MFNPGAAVCYIVVIIFGTLLCGFTCFFPLFQEKVLHNVMSIFTFMGASVVRQDDSYSFEVITKTLDTVIPALIQVCVAYCVLSGRAAKFKLSCPLGTTRRVPQEKIPRKAT